MSTPVRLVINLTTISLEAGDAFAAAWPERLAEVQAEPGCRQYELFRSVSHPENFTVLESWADRDAFDAHWELERGRERLGTQHLGPSSGRRHGHNGTEIYWEQQNWGWDPEQDAWTPC